MQQFSNLARGPGMHPGHGPAAFPQNILHARTFCNYMGPNVLHIKSFISPTSDSEHKFKNNVASASHQMDLQPIEKVTFE